MKTEGVLVALNDLLIKTLSSQNTAEIVRINRSMGIMLVVPCVALGRSLEIFGNLRNILESAIAFPVTNVRKEAVLACHLLLSVPNCLAADFPEEKVAEELRAVVKQHLPSVRSTSLSIFHGDEQHDRLDVCLLLGGDSATRALFADDVSLARFHQAMAGQTSWETYGLSEDRVRAAGDVLMHYDFALEKARGTSPSDGRRAGANGNKKSSGPRRGNGRAPGKATLRTDRV
ncbi:MAG: hypothetical protein A2147_11125 [Chloroflexi bacterium RBG_16_57_8]|nr:MAG: hypothetical protein A2147_11125 [Chloroflexi bacterium RBG_16_57_8]